MKVRVRHDPPNLRYMIESKQGLFGDWAYKFSFYYTSRPKDQNAVFPQQEEAKERAIELAKYLLEDAIVWEGSAK